MLPAPTVMVAEYIKNMTSMTDTLFMLVQHAMVLAKSINRLGGNKSKHGTGGLNEMNFDELISNGQLTKAARLFAKEYYDSGRMGHTRKLLIERLADKCDTYDAEIARQSVTSEEVQRAIDLLKEIQHDKYVIQNYTENDVKNYELVSFAITALQAYQPTISKMETTTCEWCEIARACEYNVTFFEDDNRWATERSLLPKYCPNCGRRLEEKNHGSKENN